MYIDIKNYTKRIGNEEVLKDVSLHLESGKIYGLKGRNGSGKTMLMRAISGLMSATEGEIDIDGKILGKDISFPESIGLLLENPAFLPQYSGVDNLKMIASLKGVIGEDDIKAIIRRVGLEPDDKKKYRKYSLGMKQKLGIACAVMEKPKLVILDEPVNAVDEDGIKVIRDVLNELKKEDRIIIIACHDKEELFYLSDTIIEIEKGKILKQYDVEVHEDSIREE